MTFQVSHGLCYHDVQLMYAHHNNGRFAFFPGWPVLFSSCVLSSFLFFSFFLILFNRKFSYKDANLESTSGMLDSYCFIYMNSAAAKIVTTHRRLKLQEEQVHGC